MAYLFSKLNEAIDGQQGNGRASDLIGQQQGGGQPAQQDRETPGAQNAIASQPSAIIGGASQARPAAPGEAATSVNSESRAKVFQKNQGAELVADTGKTTDAIANTTKDLQSEANKFVGEQQYAQVGDDVIGKAVREGDERGKKAITSLLYGAAEPAKVFGGKDESLNSLRKEVEGFNSTDGRMKILKGRGDLTQGEANLDAALLGKSTKFKGQQQDLIGKFAALKGVSDAEISRTGEAVQRAVRDREADKGRVRSALGTLRQGSQDADFTARKSENDARQGLTDRSRVVYGETRDAILKRPEFSDETFAGITNRQALDRIFDDPSLAKFMTRGAEVDKFVSAEGATRFNRINELLGEGGRIAATGSLGGRGGFDEAGYRAAVADLVRGLQPALAPIPPPPSSSSGGGGGASPIPRVVDRGVRAVEVVQQAGRDIDPTNKDGYTHPVTGGANVIRDVARPVVKAVLKPVTRGITKVKAVPASLGNEGVVGPRKETPKKLDAVGRARKFFGV